MVKFNLQQAICAVLCSLMSATAQPSSAEETCTDWRKAPFWSSEPTPGILSRLLGSHSKPDTRLDDVTLARIEMCIGKIGDINEKTQGGFTPLIVASEVASDPRIIEMLVRAGAAIDLKDADGTTAIQHAASTNPNPEIIHTLARHGADLSVMTREGVSLLSIAAMQNLKMETIDLLLTLGLDPEGRDQFGLTALHYAARNSSNKAAIERLIAVTSDIDVRTNIGWTPLHQAAYGGDLVAVATLLEHGADPNAEDYKVSATPVHSAAANTKYPRVFELLAEAGGDLDYIPQTDGQDTTPLIVMVSTTPHRPAYLVKALLDAGASASLRDEEGLNALEAARLNDAPKAIIDLLEAAMTTQSPQTTNDCAALTDNARRLACYDRSSHSGADTPTEPELLGGSQWDFEDEKSNLDGRRDVWLSVPSENSQPNQISRPERARFWVRCMENRTNAFITFNDYTPDNQNVRYRLDQGGVRSIWMEHMAGGDGIGVWSGRRAIPFVRSIFGRQKLVVSYDSYSNSSLEFTFDVSGLRDQIAPLATSCQWTP